MGEDASRHGHRGDLDERGAVDGDGGQLLLLIDAQAGDRGDHVPELFNQRPLFQVG